ncbi:hypothetical protein LOTGIDRAFT_229695 [Lottia gigantea]|uniref:Uncharacterized protein n=1 Tax=Lottia gigantea TaxID=225164 RepID=V3ZP18_LOTGI|nr:hypothetical protein LOTGIDRAFT_229695 [Lottia gigantea]ESO84240.1 hypothetical protein LOTGIDRAFT_229695 [Lottia gigantea]
MAEAWLPRMCLYQVLSLFLVTIINFCNATDLYRLFDEQTYTSSTQNLPEAPGKCNFRIGNGKTHSVRLYRRFQYPDSKFSCLHFHCTLNGEVKLMVKVSGCLVNDKCLKFGETFSDDQCRTWTCGIDYKLWLDSQIIKMGVFLERMKTKCLLNDKCHERGTVIEDKTDCITKRCTIYGRPLDKWKFGALQYWKPIKADCKIDDTCYKYQTVYNVGCSTYKCNSKVKLTVRKLNDGRDVVDYLVEGGPEFVKNGCKRFNSAGCLDVGDHTRFGQCIEYTCMENGVNMLTQEGCPNALTGECGQIGDVINPLPCIKLQCQKSGNTYYYKYDNEGCYNGSNCTDIGYVGYDPKSDCSKTCQKVVKNGLIQYKLAGDCLTNIGK